MWRLLAWRLRPFLILAWRLRQVFHILEWMRRRTFPFWGFVQSLSHVACLHHHMSDARVERWKLKTNWQHLWKWKRPTHPNTSIHTNEQCVILNKISNNIHTYIWQHNAFASRIQHAHTNHHTTHKKTYKSNMSHMTCMNHIRNTKTCMDHRSPSKNKIVGSLEAK